MGQGADIGAFGASNVCDEMGGLPIHHIKAHDVHRARCSLHVYPLASKVVQRHAVSFERRVHGRRLLNIAKQVNILCSDAGYPLEDIVIFPTTGALGYGIEYAYSMQERGRLAGLTGDKLLAQPVLCDAGFEAWRAKEAKAPPFEGVTDETRPQWGVMWEAATAMVLMQSGTEIIVMRHPDAIEHVRTAVRSLVDSEAS